MLTTGSKFFYGTAIFLVVAGIVYGYATGGGGTGPLSFGYKGGVGDHVGYTVLMTAGLASLAAGLLTSAFRDADPDALAEVAGTENPPAAQPAGPSWWPVAGAFAVGIAFLGLVVSNVLFVAGLIAMGVVAIEWTMQAWADRATGDPRANREIRNRLMYPVEIPVAGALVAAVVVVGASRVLLAVSELGAVAVAGVVATLILIGGAVIASKPALRSDLVAGLLVVGVVGVVAAGIVAGVSGEREFEHEEVEHQEVPEDTGAEVIVGDEEEATGFTRPWLGVPGDAGGAWSAS